MPEYIMHQCNNWGQKNCRPDVIEYFLAKQIGEGEPTPLWPTGEEQVRLDQICRNCDYLEEQE